MSNKLSLSQIILPAGLMGLLVTINLVYGFLMFHTLVELFTVMIGILMFVVVWSTFRYSQNYFLLYIGCGYFWVAMFDVFHTLSYKGMPFLGGEDAHVSVHFWVYTRFFEALILLTSSYFIKRTFKSHRVFWLFSMIALCIFCASYYLHSPVFFIEEIGVTQAKIFSEYAIIGLLLVTLGVWHVSIKNIETHKKLLLISALLLTIGAEFCFTQYIDVYGVSNQVGHLLKFLSFWLMYLTIVKSTLQNPISAMTLAARSYDAIPFCVVITDHQGNIKQANRSANKMHPNIVEKNTHVHDEFHDTSVSRHECKVCQHIKNGQTMAAEVFRVGSEQWALISVDLVEQETVHPSCIQISIDISDEMRNKQKMLLSDGVFNNMGEGILVTDKQHRIISVNPSFCQTTGYSQSELLGEKPSILSSGKHSDEFYKMLWLTLLKTGAWKGEILNRKKNGEVIPELVSITSIYSPSGEFVNNIAVYSDIVLLKEAQDKLEYLAHHDVLTKLPNRMLFNSLLDQAMNRRHKEGNKIALLFVDLDHFKYINDTLGHSVGDQVLKSAGERLQSALRKGDVLSRHGGDEFMVFVENIGSSDMAGLVAKKILSVLEPAIYHHEGQALHVSASVGIALYPDDAKSPEDLAKYADAAMFKAKESGRNYFCFHRNEDNDGAIRQLLIENHLRKAIDNNEISVVYQPKVDSETFEIVGAEALVRWFNPVLGNVYPDEFIAVAESIGIIQIIGEFVLAKAIKQVALWREMTGKPLSVAVNFSSRQFSDQRLDKLIFTKLEQYSLPGNALEVEITESLLLNKNDLIYSLLDSIAAYNISIAIDDFGTGYSSLSYLKKFPINIIKIDRAFIQDVINTPDDAVLVKAIIMMAHGLNMKVVAEGIEDKPQLDFYKQENGDLVQGYYFSKPLTHHEFVSLLKQGSVIKM